MIQMIAQHETNYQRIAEAIGYIKENFKSQPGLEEVAEKVALSPFHFQRLFTDWAGVSPKKFLQYLTVEYAKSILKKLPLDSSHKRWCIWNPKLVLNNTRP